MKQLKEAGSNADSGKASGGPSTQSMKREVAALSVEHEMLTAQVEEMKQFIANNPGGAPDASVNYKNGGAGGNDRAQEIEELEEELGHMQAENQDLN